MTSSSNPLLGDTFRTNNDNNIQPWLQYTKCTCKATYLKLTEKLQVSKFPFKTTFSTSHYYNYCNSHIYAQLMMYTAGASPGFGRGGGQEFFFSDLGSCMSRSDMLRMTKPCALLGGFGGMPPRNFFLKWCNLVRFGVYFDQILSLTNFKNYHFLYKNFKNCNFYIKE